MGWHGAAEPVRDRARRLGPKRARQARPEARESDPGPDSRPTPPARNRIKREMGAHHQVRELGRAPDRAGSGSGRGPETLQLSPGRLGVESAARPGPQARLQSDPDEAGRVKIGSGPCPSVSAVAARLAGLPSFSLSSNLSHHSSSERIRDRIPFIEMSRFDGRAGVPGHPRIPRRGSR
jgi:hypothetical protein